MSFCVSLRALRRAAMYSPKVAIGSVKSSSREWINNQRIIHTTAGLSDHPLMTVCLSFECLRLGKASVGAKYEPTARHAVGDFDRRMGRASRARAYRIRRDSGD